MSLGCPRQPWKRRAVRTRSASAAWEPRWTRKLNCHSYKTTLSGSPAASACRTALRSRQILARSSLSGRKPVRVRSKCLPATRYRPDRRSAVGSRSECAANVSRPLSVDVSAGAGSAALLSAARTGHKSPRIAQAMLALGVMATLAANASSGLGHGIAGMLVGAWPAVAFIGSTGSAW
jgi:hypothetical protein